MTAEEAQRKLWLRPGIWIFGFVGVCALLLAESVSLPIGAHAWDVAVYLDASQRIANGQWPHIDFFAPAGGLGYALFAALARLFPDGQPLLVAQWCILPLTLPLMALTSAEVARRSRPLAIALLLPLLFFSALPVNGVEAFPYPGFDAFGIYNRHCAQLLYVLVAGLVWLRSPRRRAVLVAGCLLALFWIKITGFIAGGLIVGYALLAARLGRREFLAALAAFALALAGLELTTGLVGAYVGDIATLVALNSGGVFARILTMASLKGDVLAPALMLALALAWFQREALRALLAPRLAALCVLADSDLGWLLAVLGAAALFETQNTGSQEFICLWPVLLRLLSHWQRPAPGRALVLTLIAATALPTAVKVGHRAARALISAPGYEELSAPELGRAGQWLAKPELLKRARFLLAHYAENRAAYEDFAKAGELPSTLLFSEIDYQIAWLLNAEEAASALRGYEAAQGWRFESLFTLDFADLMPFALNRAAPAGVPIGLDAFRTFPKPTPEVMAALSETDAILIPTCPVTTARKLIAERYAPAFAGRPEIALTPCWTLRPKG